MNKVICDICGTSYSETATQCPICGTVRPTDAITIDQENGNKENNGYTHVKGGRFSKSNVRKRNKTAKKKNNTPSKSEAESSDNEKLKKLILSLVVVLLLLIVVIVSVVIGISSCYGNPQDPDVQDTTVSDTTVPDDVPCAELSLDHYEFTMKSLDEVLMLTVTKTPASTTDTVEFESDNPNVVSVTKIDEGTAKLVCTGNGSAVITVTCGDVSKQCRITCEIDDAPAYNENDLRFLQYVCEGEVGFKWVVYDDTVYSIPSELIQWTSDDETIATFKDGVITLLAEGETVVHATYGSKTIDCVVRFVSEESSGGEDHGNQNNQGNQGNQGNAVPATKEDYLNHKFDTNVAPAISYNSNQGMYDITIKVGESYKIFLLDANNNALNVTWYVKVPESGTVSVEIDNNVLRCFSNASNDVIYCIYEGKEYCCKIITRAAS